jgi:hypothetical protein
MKLPSFQPSTHFLNEYELPCIVARVKNSEFPGLAFEHIAECGEDPDCEIFLRGPIENAISPWQQKILDQLFEQEGLSAAVAEGMKEYASSSKWGGKNYAELAEEDRQKIKEHGIAPHITISTIVIDEVKHQVILRADTIVDGNLDEHGISIYLNKDRWRFDTAEYFDRYAATLLGSEEQQVKRAWKLLDKMYPVSAGMSLETDLGPIIGDWIVDVPESTKLLKMLWTPEKARDFGPHESETMSITSETIRTVIVAPTYRADRNAEVVRCQRWGGKVIVYVEWHTPHGPQGFESGYWWTGEILVTSVGRIYRRTKI